MSLMFWYSEHVSTMLLQRCLQQFWRRNNVQTTSFLRPVPAGKWLLKIVQDII